MPSGSGDAQFRGAGITDVRIVMREYPLLGDHHARRGWDWALGLRNSLAARPWLDFLATDFLAVGTKPPRSAAGNAWSV